MKNLLLISIVVICSIITAYGHKILMISLLPSKSHYNLNKPIADLLTNKGHEVTFITIFPSNNSKHREIGIPEVESLKESTQNFGGFKMNKMGMVDMIKMMAELQPTIVKMLFDNQGVKKLLNDKTETFDLVIVEHFDSEFLFGLGVKYNCPVITISPISLMQPLAIITGNPLSLATVPNPMLGITKDMNFIGKIKNVALSIVFDILLMTVTNPQQEKLYNQYFEKESSSVPFEALMGKLSLTFVNTHPAYAIPRPYLPNTIEVGGYHIDDPKPLPKDLQEIMDKAKHGVVLFSMGSVLTGSNMEVEMRDAFLKSLGKLKETVLWKFEEDIPNKPSNIIVRSWLPQTSILAHPNLKLFMTHGGLLSCTESIHFGAPLVAIPVFGDQPYNAEVVHDREQGIRISFDNVTETSLDWALKTVLSDPKYKDNAKKLQKLYNDRPMKPRDLIAYYVDHVIRTKGAEHLSPPRLSRFSLLLLDVALVVLGVSATIVILLVLLIRKCCGKSKRSDVKKIKTK